MQTNDEIVTQIENEIKRNKQNEYERKYYNKIKHDPEKMEKIQKSNKKSKDTLVYADSGKNVYDKNGKPMGGAIRQGIEIIKRSQFHNIKSNTKRKNIKEKVGKPNATNVDKTRYKKRKRIDESEISEGEKERRRKKR